MTPSKNTRADDLRARVTAIVVGLVWAWAISIALWIPSAPWSVPFASISSLTSLALLLSSVRRAASTAERRFNQLAAFLLLVILVPSISTLYIHARNTRTIGDPPDFGASDYCKRGDLVVPNGHDLVASIRRTACAPAFAPDDIEYYVFVHGEGDHDSADNLVLHYKANNSGRWPVISPRVFWSKNSRLHVSLPTGAATTEQLTRLGATRISYDFGPRAERSIVAMPVPTRSRGSHLLPVPKWSQLRVGIKVFLAEDPYGTTYTTTVCANAASYYAATVHSAPGCIHAQYGAAATVLAVIPSRLNDLYYPAPLALVRAINGHWEGVISVLELQPDIHPGTVITMNKKEFPVQLHHCQDHCADLNNDPTLELPGKVRVRVLQYDPRGAFDSLYVQVLDGPYAGNRGWTEASYARSADSLNSNLYGLDYSPIPELEPDSAND